MKGVFKCAREDDKKIQECQALKLGDAPVHPQEIFKETQASKLGDAPEGIPSFFNKYQYVFGFVLFMRYVKVLERLLHLVFTFSFMHHAGMR